MRCLRLGVWKAWILPLLLSLWLAVPPASAALLSATGTLSAARGGTVAVDLQVDELVDFESVDLRILFDATRLSFVDAAMRLDLTGTSFPGLPFPAGSGLTAVDVSFGVGGLPVTASAATLLTASFSVLANAPFDPTTVQFLSLDRDLLDVGPLDVTITVLQPTTPPAVPAPGGPALVLLALAAASLARRCRPQGC